MHEDRKVKIARSVFPVTSKLAYLSTGSFGPLSTIVVEALQGALSEDLHRGRAYPQRHEAAALAKERVRALLAQLLNASPSEIVLTQNTTDALRTVIEQLPWEDGDEAVCTQLEHEACTGPLQDLVARGQIALRVADAPPAADGVEWLEPHLTPRTRLVAFSAVAFKTGARMPIERIVNLARDRGAYTLLDAAQAAGSIPLDLAKLGVDFCAMPMQKWLCGPEGLGALYARSGAPSVARGDLVVRDTGVFQAAARQLEWMARELGWPWIHARTTALAAYARRALGDLPGVTLITPDAHGGLVTLSFERADPRVVAENLRRRGFVFRHIEEMGALRISTAFFNFEKEIDRFAIALRELLR